MTIRSKAFEKTITYAGTREELAAVALEYADGLHGTYNADQRQRFRVIADGLANGVVTGHTDGVRFWSDARDGAPFHGPIAYRPDPDPDWAAAEALRKARRQ